MAGEDHRPGCHPAGEVLDIGPLWGHLSFVCFVLFKKYFISGKFNLSIFRDIFLEIILKKYVKIFR